MVSVCTVCHSLYADEHPEYFREAAGDPRCFTYSVFVGVRYNMPHYDGYFSCVAMGVRAYCGNYPYGMFRSIDNFSHVGICVVYQEYRVSRLRRKVL